MNDRDGLLASVAATTADYREGDLAPPTPAHVERWLHQFETSVQLPILQEIDHVLKRTYISRQWTRSFLAKLFENAKLVGDDPCAFWTGVKFLDIQGGGGSQKEMLALFGQILSNRCGVEAADCGDVPNAFVYLDDAIFTGNRVRHDLERWIAERAPDESRVRVVTIALHTGGRYYAENKIKEAATTAHRRIDLEWWRAISFEDRKAYTTTSDVLRPASIPTDDGVEAYVAGMRFPPNLRRGGEVGKLGIFSSEAGRQVLEEEFLKAGVRIRQMCPDLTPYQRPLGNMVLDTLGFGSMIVTFRNCPNNAPLALWAGDPWYPLFQRTTNANTSIRRLMALLASDE